jgi:hypothetical protein
VLSFGFAKSYPAAVMSRVLAGILNGNVGVANITVSLFIHLGIPAEVHDAKIEEISSRTAPEYSVCSHTVGYRSQSVNDICFNLPL